MDELSFEKLPHYNFSSNRQFEKGEHHIERAYNYHVLILMRKGVLRFSENGVPVELHPGEYYIQKAGLYQQGLVASDEPNYFYIHFKGTFNKGAGLPLRGTFDIEKIQPIISKIDALENGAEKLEYEHLFYEILSTLKAGFFDEKSDAERIKSHILSHYKEDVSLDDIAKKFFLSPNQIINIVKAKYDETPYQMLMSYRLKRAAELILATDTPIQEICYYVGFHDYTAFYKAFSKKYEVSPLQYREQHIGARTPNGIYHIP